MEKKQCRILKHIFHSQTLKLEGIEILITGVYNILRRGRKYMFIE